MTETPFCPITYGIVGMRGRASCVLHATSTAPFDAREMLICACRVQAQSPAHAAGTFAETTRPATEQPTTCPGCSVPGRNHCTWPACRTTDAASRASAVRLGD